MYITEIHDILDKTLNKFILNWIIEPNKNDGLISFDDLTKDPNFVKYQKDINKILQFSQELISEKELQKIVSKDSNILLIKNLVLKYVSYYFFLILGINYKNKIELFNNNLVEFSRLQSNYKLKIDNFFNTESNSNIIKNVNLLKEFISYINKINESKNKNNNLIDSYSKDLKYIIDQLDKEELNKIINTNTDKKNKIIFDHNLIKIVIYLILYKTSEKKELFNIIETTETSNGEFIFIDVVIPKSTFIDYNSIESILSPSEIKTNLPETIYDLINEDYSDVINDARKYFIDFDLKIQKILDTHIIIPIVDDFLLYHKDSEKYEKKEDKFESPKKKEETKIKYIINKINTVADYYQNPNEIKKLFYVPLQNRNAVLINTFEDIKITSKKNNIIKMNNEDLDLFNDLKNYKLYPYISFKDFKKNGFIFNPESTLDAIRNVSFKNLEKFDILQNRIISENMLVNIVGFAIINNDNHLDCLDMNTFINISNETNDILQVVKVLLENKIRNKIFLKEDKNLKKNYFWLFDLEKQKYNIPYYDISENMPKNEIVKIISAYLYDYTLETIINIIKEDINESHPKIITYYIDNLNNIKNKYSDILNPQYSKNLNELEFLIYYIKSKKNDNNYDFNEDKFPGLFDNIYKLPIVPKKPPPKIPKLNIFTDFKIKNVELKKNDELTDVEISSEDYETKDYLNAVCQHIITWDKLDELKKNNNIKYSDLIYEFLQQYINITPEQEYICKSCKSSINIKKYILDGAFDNLTQSFITFSVHIDVRLEELPEYEKFKTSIRSLEKIIERISSIINIQGLTGISYSNKIKRRNIVKDSIDLILIHNNYLKNSSYLSSRDKLIKNFGINKNLSNLYIFELDNNVFVYSSKDKDFYKFLKYNNVITYIIILLILEMNDTHILSLNNNKECSYYFYKKIGFSLFENFNIIVNKSFDTQPIKNYPILCYLIYISSCFISQYNLWGDTISTEQNVIEKKKFNLIIQKSIINTIIEILNSILNVNVDELKSQKIYLYEIFQTKYYFKIEFFKDINLIKKLDKMYLKDSINKSEKIILNDSSIFDIVPNKNIENNFIFDDLFSKFSKKHTLDRFNIVDSYISNFNKKYYNMDNISNLSNCITGEFHDFKPVGKEMICNKCNEIANPNNFIPDSIKLFYKRYSILYLRKIAKKYCKNGLIHKFNYDSTNDINVCSNCKYQEGTVITYSDKELYDMYNIIENNKKKNNLIVNKILKEINSKNTNEINKIKIIFNKIVYKFQKYDNNINKSIDILLDIIQKLLGIDIIINNTTYNLYHNIYIIDHDNNGLKLEQPILVYEKENKFRIVENHPFFKRGVLIYTIQKNTKYELFYDLQEKFLLGYREINKEYIFSKKNNNKIKINYSIKNMLLMFGFTRQQINIRDFYPEIYGITSDQFDNKFKNKLLNFDMSLFINKIASRRFNSIKKLGYELKKYINRIKNNYKVTIISFEATYFNNMDQQVSTTYISESTNPLDILYTKYEKKLDTNIITEINEKNNIHLFLKYINCINQYLPFENINLSKNDYNVFSELVDYNFIIKNDFISNITLNYIIDEIIRLINYNSNKNVKTNLIHFIIDIITILFNQFNLEISKIDSELNYFYQILYTSEFYLETQTSELMIDAIDYYSNQETIKNLDNLDEDERNKIINDIEDDNEELIALDVDIEMDMEGQFDLYSNYDWKYNKDY